ncbi:MAG: hypothetical protein D6717_02690 [Gammaproteobacteria bacterium]|nr:MAG: hypothetical protein D6717_02690 [Gammaproteobacteria bacterium]
MSEQKGNARGMVQAIYILYLVSIVVGITGLIGVILAYVYRGNAEPWLESHFRFQIRTFWIGLLYSLIGMLTAPLFVGYLVLLFVLVWLIVRCAKGLQWLDRGQAVPDPATWLW